MPPHLNIIMGVLVAWAWWRTLRRACRGEIGAARFVFSILALTILAAGVLVGAFNGT